MKGDQTEILQQIKDLESFVAALKANTKAPAGGVAGFLPYLEIAFLIAREHLSLEPRPSAKAAKIEAGIAIDKVFVISLDFRNDRRESVVAQMAREGITFSFFDAIRGKNLDLGQVSDSLVPGFTKRHLSPGKIGCCLSHALIKKRRIKAYHAEPVLVNQGGFSSNILRKDLPMAVQNIHEGEI